MPLFVQVKVKLVDVVMYVKYFKTFDLPVGVNFISITAMLHNAYVTWQLHKCL